MQNEQTILSLPCGHMSKDTISHVVVHNYDYKTGIVVFNSYC